MTNQIIALWLKQIIFTFFGYFFICTIFYLLKRKQTQLFKKILNPLKSLISIPQEILYSLQLLCLNASIVLITYFTKLHYNYSPIYFDIKQYGIVYFLFSILLLTIFSDFIFYWVHRIMHIKILYKYIHEVHHRSKSPNAFSGFSFHTLEAFSIGLFCFYVPALLIPWHPISFSIYSIFCIFWISFIHSGLEIKKGNPLYFIMNTSIDHNNHHQFIYCNYSLYYSIWDRIFKTHRGSQIK